VAEEPRTAEAKEGTEQEHHGGQGMDRAEAPPRPSKGLSRSTAEAEEWDQEGAPPRLRNGTEKEHRQGLEPRNGAARGLEPRNKRQPTSNKKERVKKERKAG
jgi:hypothetical protein